MDIIGSWCLSSCYHLCHCGRGWIPCKQTVKPERSHWVFHFIPAGSPNRELSNPLWSLHLPPPLHPSIFLPSKDCACKTVCVRKVPFSPLWPLRSALAVFWCVAAERSCFPEMPAWRQQREGQVYFRLSGGGTQQILPYVPTTQHLLRQRNEAVALLKESHIKGNMRLH